MKRRNFIQAISAAVLAMSGFAFNAAAALPAIDVYKSATCGCCSKWIEHLQANGFKVNAHDVPSPSDYRSKFGMPQELGSCHSARVDGYALEGHVPASEVKRLLAERPKAKGLAVPAMPLGSPGMEVDGARSDPYDVLLVKADGSHSVYRHYDGAPAKNAAGSAAQMKPAMTEGEIKKVDKAAGKLTIKHGPITNLDMPGMTMAFRVKEAAMIDQVKPGDKIRFAADKTGGALTVVKIETMN
ncbi:copper-binding protein [Noviherbaspirillum cavernae]|uniref:copper-binding protein n=1 Tax=Noviherbaspirillum cavernae TaxID=2320862 RepID=UPI001313E024